MQVCKFAKRVLLQMLNSFFTSINKIFISGGELGIRLSFYEVFGLSWYFLSRLAIRRATRVYLVCKYESRIVSLVVKKKFVKTSKSLKML